MKTFSFLVILLASFVLTSCGGTAATLPSPFEGNFNGTWTSTGPDIGTAMVNINAAGTYTGTEIDTTISLQGTVTGHLNNGGTFTGIVHPDGGSPIPATGNFSISQDGNTLSGTSTFGGVTYTYTLTRT